MSSPEIRPETTLLMETDIPNNHFEKESIDISGSYGETQRENLYKMRLAKELTIVALRIGLNYKRY